MFLLSRALARQTSCLCPTEKFSPRSCTWWSRPSGRLRTCPSRWADRSADHRDLSEWELQGSRLNRRLPENSVGSCRRDPVLKKASIYLGKERRCVRPAG